MAISNKLETVGSSIRDVRTALKELDRSLGQGNITTLDDDIRKLQNDCCIVLYLDENGGYKIKYYYCNSTVIPGWTFFDQYDESLVAVILPEKIIEIPTAAFQDSTLQYINLKNIQKFGGNNTFDKCTKLNSISIGEKGVLTTTAGVFRNCTSLAKVTLLNTSSGIPFGHSAFDKDVNIKHVLIANLEAYLKNTFVSNTANPLYYAKHLYNLDSTEIITVDIPNTITSISDYAFNNAEAITSVTIPSSVTSIGKSAFQGCSGLTGTLIIPSSVTSIGASALRGLTGLTNIVINTLADPVNLFYTALVGNGTGTLWFNAGVNAVSSNTTNLSFKNIVVTGNYNCTFTSRYALGTSANLETIRISGNLTSTEIIHNSTAIKFCECNGTLSGANGLFIRGGQRGVIVHLGYDGIACAPNNVFSSNATTSIYWTKIYVGDGSSAAHDNAILAQYLADTDWSAYSAKLDTWYNYVQSGGKYATPPTIPTE